MPSHVDEAELNQTERVIITLQFMYGFEQQEIGPILGLTYSRISQLNSGAMRKLRGAFGGSRKPLFKKEIAA